ncbi:MAG: phosphatidylserine decarboxylase [Gammaproteobacteria bacterium]|nr:MAG: phosphatidylserine decarboxylase [Gammaproteobacteria bacterium]TND06674.1 MAG: phosphatidylserine decarboxylase [Gammaproteobacteria bacterium]
MQNHPFAVARRYIDAVLVAWQFLFPQHLISRFMYWFTRIESPAVKNRFTGWFVGRFGVDMQQALETDPHAYNSFNAFFTRALKPAARPIVTGENELACPVDGAVSQIGNIVETRLFQAKGRYFSLESLLGGSRELASRFRNGRFATIYLSPKDYHRIHMPVAGDLEQMIYVPGQLFSVNRLTTRAVRNLFARNERVICVYRTAAGPMAVVMVGAICVASIETVWAGQVTPHRPREVASWSYEDRPVHLERGAEMGRFNMGSTVVVLFGPACVEWAAGLTADTTVRMGQLLGTKTTDRQPAAPADA